ncbi:MULTISPECIES: LysR family transcriptional regulator [Brevibacillus]|uniref:LysR family transcriptional regulator n=1 Tax=Brevibacillus TaxID=55080 RepID=UPI000D10CB08|nr:MULTISPECIES: LysR family transcriptional regulator [Brevibacillus]MED1947995.1 LysR family transcriptional regulator [Brevibacillus formosus]MED1998274.1 LysR family transcriptional regulator [Brevibacillus formosus]MED2080815.1 LysR family transcriptional regulator [Brevibacillus formosus]PSK20519.1 LysR family transcriptional regulator [Brevibacillus sp. NRRL NRS-603]
MEYRDWYILQTLYQEQNITKTAESLYLSQPALTKRLRQIEKEFGVQIVQRGSRGVHFTPQGEYLAKCADEMLLRLRNIKEHVLNMGDEVNGTLRLGVSNYFARYKLPMILKKFKEAYPNVEYKVMTGWSKDVYKSVYNQDVHVGFVRGSYNWSDQKYLLFEESVYVVSTEPIHLDDLPSLPRIDYETDPMLRALVDDWWTERFSQPPLIGMEVDKADTCSEMVANGLGYAILPRGVLNGKDDLHMIELTTAEGEPIKRSTWMFYHADSMDLQMVKAFVRFMEQGEIAFID